MSNRERLPLAALRRPDYTSPGSRAGGGGIWTTASSFLKTEDGRDEEHREALGDKTSDPREERGSLDGSPQVGARRATKALLLSETQPARMPTNWPKEEEKGTCKNFQGQRRCLLCVEKQPLSRKVVKGGSGCAGMSGLIPAQDHCKFERDLLDQEQKRFSSGLL